jgi:hypothetical protein
VRTLAGQNFHLFTFKLSSGANPAIASYNARAVKNYNATGSLCSTFFLKKSFIIANAEIYCNAGVVVVNSKVVGLAPRTALPCYFKKMLRSQLGTVAGSCIAMVIFVERSIRRSFVTPIKMRNDFQVSTQLVHM